MDLRDRLVEVADELTDVLPPRGLWEETVRRHARLRRDTGVILGVAAVLLIATFFGSWRAAQPPEPLAPVGESRLPDRFFTPSPWLPGTDNAGELGPLIAVRPAERHSWFGTERGLVGVGAATGEYRFLDLPDLADLGSAALSPNGRSLAYWTVGDTSGTPHERGSAVNGMAVYDTVTGDVRRGAIASEHGLATDTLFFADNETLFASFSRWRGGYDGTEMERSSADRATSQWWRLSEEGPEEATFEPQPGPLLVPAARDARIWSSSWVSRGSVVVDVTGEPVVRRLREPVNWGGGYGALPEGALSQDGTRLAILASDRETGRTPNRIAVHDLPGSGDQCCEPARLVPHSGGTFAPLWWLDQHRVAALRRLDSLDAVGLVAMDTRDGAAEVLSRFDDGVGATSWLLAFELLDSPVATATAPPHPWDPRGLAGLVGSVVVVTGLAVWLRRRRS